MLINSVILVLREVLEAALLISVLLALSVRLRLSLSWLLWALPATAIAVTLFAGFLDVMTDAFDGAGQELASALLQAAVFLSLAGIVYFCSCRQRQASSPALPLALLMSLAATCALTREVSEVLIYVAGFAASPDHRTAVFAGGAIGAGIGISMGVLLYAGLRALRFLPFLNVCYVLLALIGAGMVMQSTMLLEQVDWMPVGQQLWDSSALVGEQSLTGQLLYAVFGYEATPSVVQGGIYLFCLATIAAAWALPGLSDRTGVLDDAS